MHRVRALLALALALVAGCGGPELIVRTIPETEGGRVYFRPVRDGEGNEFPNTAREEFIGEIPTEWEIPEPLLGGNGALRIDFGGGVTNEVYDFKILKDKDTVVSVSRPKVVK